MAFAFTCVLPGTTVQTANTRSDDAWKLARLDPAALVRRVSQVELSQSIDHRPAMRFRLRKIAQKSDTTKEIVETSGGAVARLIGLNGKPLTREQNRQEEERLEAVAANPAIEAHRRKSERRDTNRVQEIMRLLPDAYLYQYADSATTPYGSAIHLTFVPNPKFSPPDLMSRVLTGIQGELWIAPDDLRVVRMEGRAFKNIDYGWGLLGTLNKGGNLLLEQTKTPDCGWQLARLVLHLRGKALVFKRVRVSVDESATDYHRIPANWTYKDAARWLLNHTPTPER